MNENAEKYMKAAIAQAKRAAAKGEVPVGAVIGSHIGPGGCGIIYIAE